MYDVVVVGAGFAGSVLARKAAEANRKVLVIEKRAHIGGNAYDEYQQDGILIHKYGPHIFHTNERKVWDFISRFTEWYLYEHKVLAAIEGTRVPIPFNFNTLYELFPSTMANRIESLLLETFEFGSKIPILQLKRTSDKELKNLAEYIYRYVFLGYTVKQWGCKPEELDENVTARIPIHLSRDNRYFQDQYQGLPQSGYTKMFEKMLDHKNIHIMLNTPLHDVIQINHETKQAYLLDSITLNCLIYTGKIDEFFNYKFGSLPYRSLDFTFETLPMEHYQELGQVNYPNNDDFTRITEYKYLTGQNNNNVTTISKEYPVAHKDGFNTPYYPIPKQANSELLERYSKEALQYKSVHFIGRLAEYKYYNMDTVVSKALNLSETLFK
ncbi:UDP-galactopyranose mutase [Desulfuribacillus stibiiarsenatis]|uniref:UDP-galactopyranose mutase n=1 Tax=Desulfuribacillus stibiiarsenatis TaxID=1390249 RepID=A0A1E5L9K9_9FIRM|nr:UDP-galactopyranose mutase [Desulfuribacillus stibiiarsenatis]OEH86748.1 UDP-galactopyranose mutase [Desulfuribacillus stibiiarsenatis]